MSRKPDRRGYGASAGLMAPARRALLAAARAALYRHLCGDTGAPSSATTSGDSPLPAHHGVFVTLRTGEELRGCIGTLDPSIPLQEAVEGCAVSAATDPRFLPLEPAELAEAHIEVSALGPCRRIREGSEVVIGRDGVKVSRGSRRGLLLPQVAVQQEWEASRLLDEVCVKAGLPPHAWRSPETVVEAFSAEVFGEPDP